MSALSSTDPPTTDTTTTDTTPLPDFSTLMITSSPLNLLIDVHYPFPLAPRPRKERVNALSKQIYNFLLSHSQWSSTCTLQIWGTEENVKLIETRLNKLIDNEPTLKTIENLLTYNVGDIIFPKHTPNESSPTSKIYLSPDSPNPLTSLPSSLIIGGLIDRTITPNRSLTRSSSHPHAHLPLNKLNLEGLESDEPLNVDTCLEMCALWKEYDDFEKGGREAMERHEVRHPNRRIHKT